jgi:hypothetical protein
VIAYDADGDHQRWFDAVAATASGRSRAVTGVTITWNGLPACEQIVKT